MKGATGLILTLIGGAIMLAGGAYALLPLVRLYQANLADPMAQPQGAEQATSDEMIHGVLIGAVGVPIFLVGIVMMKVALFRKLMKRAR